MWTDEEVAHEAAIIQRAALDEIARMEESIHSRVVCLLAQIATLEQELALADAKIDELRGAGVGGGSGSERTHPTRASSRGAASSVDPAYPSAAEWGPP